MSVVASRDLPMDPNLKDEEEEEEGVIATDSEEEEDDREEVSEEEEESSSSSEVEQHKRRHHHRHKSSSSSSKKRKKDKKKKKSKKHRRHRSRSHTRSSRRRRRSSNRHDEEDEDEHNDGEIIHVSSEENGDNNDEDTDREARDGPTPEPPGADSESESEAESDRQRRRRKRRRPESDDDDDRPSRRSGQRRRLRSPGGDEASGSLPGGTPDTVSLSVEDTNKLRASLGLAPLKAAGPEGASGAERAELEAKARSFGGTLIPNSNKNEILVPAENLSEKSLAEKLRERLQQRRERRKQEAKLLLTKGLGEESDDADESAHKWIRTQKKRAAEDKAEAEKRARALQELDDELEKGQQQYKSSHLAGLKIEHDADAFADSEGNVVLTLKDADVLDDSAADTLINVNMAEDEHTRKKLADARKAGYNAYDDEETVDAATGEVTKKATLAKYDEEIDGFRKQSFTIGSDGKYSEADEARGRKEAIRARLAASSKNLVSLETPAPRVASDYYTAEEAEARFKKPKKKTKRRKRQVLKADDLAPLHSQEGDFGSRGKVRRAEKARAVAAVPMDIDDDEDNVVLGNTIDLSSVKVEEDEDDLGLELALKKARRLKQKAAAAASDLVLGAAGAEHGSVKTEPGMEFSVKKEEEEDRTGSEFISTFDDLDEDGRKPNKVIILNETAEFCRNLGARQYNEYADKRAMQSTSSKCEEVDQDLLDFEDSLRSRDARERERERGRWAAVNDEADPDMDVDDERRRYGANDDDDTDTEDSPNAARRPKKTAAILEEEPNLRQGVAAAIQMAMSKGYLETEQKAKSGRSLKHLEAKNYTIDDKMRGDADDRGRGGRDRRDRERERGGPGQSFEDKPGYVPNVKLEYVDDSGRLLNQKEAFRHLSHKFHGKVSGKLKTEKRMKKVQEQNLMRNMSSTDTPLNTVEKLRKKTAECATPYLVLSGNKINPQDLKK